jgi:hypothetical protein
MVGTIRRDLLDHVIPLNERHLLRLSQAYIRYYDEDRTHIGLKKETPSGRTIEKRPCAASQVVALPRIGGLHHRYSWSAAAYPAATCDKRSDAFGVERRYPRRGTGRLKVLSWIAARRRAAWTSRMRTDT